MTISDYEKANNRCKALGDFRLEHRAYKAPGCYVMVTLDDPSVGIFQQTLSPEFFSPSNFEEWLDFMEEIFRK